MANIKSIGGNPIVLDASGIAAGAVTPDKLADMGGITAGAALGITGEATDSAAWLQRVSTADGPTTIRSIQGNTIVESGSLLPVNMTGIESTGFNQWDEQWELGSYNTTNGEKAAATTRIRCKNPIPVFPDTDYYLNFGRYSLGSQGLDICFYDANGDFLSFLRKWSASLTTPTGAYYMTWSTQPAYGTTYNHDICINLSWSGRRDGEYEAFWKSQRLIDVASYFPDGMRSAGTVRDELTATEAITRVGAVDLGTLTWTYSDSWHSWYTDTLSDVKDPGANTTVANLTHPSYEALSANYLINATDEQLGVGIATTSKRIVVRNGSSTVEPTGMLNYELATPTVTPIDPTLNLSYRVDDFGTERIMVPEDERSAPPTIVTAQGYTAESLRDAALSAIAPVENGKASTNYGVGSYLVHGGQLCKVTTAIATGEAISIGTNVTATTVMAEVIALIAQ